MRRKIFTITILIVAVLTILLMSACGGNDTPKIVGQWKSETSFRSITKLEFFSDYTYASDSSYNGNYSIDGNRLKLNRLDRPITCSFEVKGKKLILTDGEETAEFIKVE